MRNRLMYYAITSLFFILMCGGALLPVTYAAEEANTGITYSCVENHGSAGGAAVFGNCTWSDLVAALQKVITIARNYALAFSVVVIAYAGYLYMVSGDNAGKRKEANDMFVKVAWGIFYILGAWLIVKLITGALLSDEYLQSVPFGN